MGKYIENLENEIRFHFQESGQKITGYSELIIGNKVHVFIDMLNDSMKSEVIDQIISMIGRRTKVENTYWHNDPISRTINIRIATGTIKELTKPKY